MSKLIKAVFTGRFCRTQRVFQWDTDDKLQIVNVDLPTNYTVDFSNSKTGDSVSVLATSDTVQIPPDLFIPGSEIYAWIWLSDSNGGHTRCEATIPIDPRARRTGTEPTPAQASAWDEAVDTLNETIEGIPSVINSALTDAKESGEFDGADGADGNGVWYVDVQYTRTTGAGVQAQLDHMVGRPGATQAAGDLCVISDGRFGAVTIITPRVAVVPVLGDLSGKSAYELAVEHGYTGTEAEWLESLQGEDGFAPEVTIEQIDGGHRVTITSAAHPDGQSFDVLDGQGGTVTVDSALSDSSENPVQNKVIKTALDGKYTKPSGGIPNSDLAEDAQRGYTSEERVTLVPEGTYTFVSDGSGYTGVYEDLALEEVPEIDPLSPPAYATITVDGVAYEKEYNESESDNNFAVYGNYFNTETVDCALTVDLNKVRAEDPAYCVLPIVQFVQSAPDTEQEQHTFSAYFIRQPVTTTPDFDAAVAKSSAEALAEKLDTDGDAYRAASLPMGHLDSTSTATAMTAQVDGITELRDGVCVWLTNGVITSASGVTLNINSLGAKPIYNSLSGTVVTTTFVAASTYLFIYNSTRVTGGCWDMVYGYDTNTTYTPVKLGFGYATCSTAEATAAKTAALSSYTLTTGGIVAVKFTNAVPAGATLNINSKGAKAIYYKGAAITDGIIKAGDTVTMIYSTYYHVLSIDRDVDTLPPNPSDNNPYNVDFTESPGTSTAYARADHVHALDGNTLGVLLDEFVLSNIDMLVLPSGAADGSPVVLSAIWSGEMFLNREIMGARKHIAYFLIPLVQNPQDFNDFQVVSDASVSKAYVTANGLGLQYNGIADGKLYSAEFVLPFDSNQATGTLSVTDLALPSAQGVSF